MLFNNIKKRYSKYNKTELLGGYVKRYSKLYIMLLFIVATFELLLFVKELILAHHNPIRHNVYLISYIVLFVASVFSAVFVILHKNKTNNEKIFNQIIQIYAFIALAWGVTVSLMDYMGGDVFPVVFFTILATIGGLLVISPFVFIPAMIVFGIIMIGGMYIINPDLIDTGNMINILVLFVMIGVVSYRTTTVAISEENERILLLKRSDTDVLTGLRNENAYYKYLDKINKDLMNQGDNYAVIVMDVNGLKHTDDTYGHRFGAHLIRTAGQILPSVFKNSSIFHTGGDEFVCIIVDELKNLDSFLSDFEKTLEYSNIIFENQKLFLSLARGVAIHNKDEKYNDTYQRADRDMYINKRYVKEKYNIQGR